jgi:hypothetical protein
MCSFIVPGVKTPGYYQASFGGYLLDMRDNERLGIRKPNPVIALRTTGALNLCEFSVIKIDDSNAYY